MGESDKVTSYINLVTERLESDGFNIRRNINYNNQEFDIVAKRSRFHSEYFGAYADFFFIFAR